MFIGLPKKVDTFVIRKSEESYKATVRKKAIVRLNSNALLPFHI